MRFNKIYLEISNLCNLNCAFCPGTKRPPRALNEGEFTALIRKLRPWTDFLYFHLMGEPLCHPKLETFLDLAGAEGFRVILTTNGTLLAKQQEMLLAALALHKVNVSLHAFEANDLAMPFGDYLRGCFAFGQAAEGKKLVAYRLWNQGGADEMNGQILDAMKHFFPGEWVLERRGTRIGQRVYLEYGDKFDWPDLSAPDGGGKVFCYGLRDQLGVLCDGTVVPCCLDHEGDIALGNLFEQDLGDILETPRAKAIFQGFSDGKAAEELCRKCGYARRFG
ncbi:MAG: SPASM domain-containing protein [Oscillospiraceae bacterium]|nr:SPASM domain-containing protein [Oscillospiraceae bacterium]